VPGRATEGVRPLSPAAAPLPAPKARTDVWLRPARHSTLSPQMRWGAPAAPRWCLPPVPPGSQADAQARKNLRRGFRSCPSDAWSGSVDRRARPREGIRRRWPRPRRRCSRPLSLTTPIGIRKSRASRRDARLRSVSRPAPVGPEQQEARWDSDLSSVSPTETTPAPSNAPCRTADVGDTFIASGNRQYRIRAIIPSERIEEFVDRPVYAIWEVEPL
jgi:hypothetical protein